MMNEKLRTPETADRLGRAMLGVLALQGVLVVGLGMYEISHDHIDTAVISMGVGLGLMALSAGLLNYSNDRSIDHTK